MTAIIITFIICISVVLIVWIINKSEPKKDGADILYAPMDMRPEVTVNDLWEISVLDEETCVIKNKNTSFARTYYRKVK